MDRTFQPKPRLASNLLTFAFFTSVYCHDDFHDHEAVRMLAVLAAQQGKYAPRAENGFVLLIRLGQS
jgi:hypothetical protein